MAPQKKSGLGRGLDALFSNSLSDPEDSVKMAAIDSILPNPKQPRTLFNEEELNELAASIKEHGIIQPLIVSWRSAANLIGPSVIGERPMTDVVASCAAHLQPKCSASSGK